MPIIGGSGGGSSSSSAGQEIGYTQLTSAVNIVSTTEATGTVILSPGALTFDGSPVICEVVALVTTPNGTSTTVTLSLFEGATQITRLTQIFIGAASNVQLIQTASPRYRFTPTAASHTYTITAFANSTVGTPAVTGGSGGTGGFAPCFVRFTKV